MSFHSYIWSFVPPPVPPPCASQAVPAIKGVSRLQFNMRQSGQVKRRRRVSRGAQGAERLDPSPEIFLLFDLKMEHFCCI